jgi:hypothetical protein
MVLPAFIPRLTLDEMNVAHAEGRLNGVFRMTSKDYHAGPGLSSTGVKNLLKSPAHFKLKDKPTDAMEFGTALHLAVLDREAFDATKDVFDGASRQSKAWDQHEAKAVAEGRLPILAKELIKIEAICNSFAKSRTWAGLVRNSEREIAAFVQEEGAAARKSMADVINAEGFISDIKTTSMSLADPTAFWRAIHDFGYHISGAYYLDVWSRALAAKLTTFIIAAAETNPPYGIRFYPLSERMLDIGRREMQRGVARYETCLDENRWECYEDRFEDIEFPSFILQRFE